MAKFTDRTGERKQMNDGEWAEIIEYRGCYDIDVKFDNGVIKNNRTYQEFKNGKIRNIDNDSMKQFRLGEINTMKCGVTAKIIEYNGSRDVKVKIIETDEIINTTYQNFKIGQIKSHYSPTLYNVGITGVIDKGESDTYCYKLWVNIMTRCYNEDYKKSRPTYKDVTICNEWKYYHNFKEWFNKHWYEIDGERIELDKDIINKGNKVYSPENCIFVPQRINSLFTKGNSKRGELPIGVTKTFKCETFSSTVSINGKNITKRFETVEEAFQDYKFRKEKEIKRVADLYKDKIPTKLYEAMYNYKVEITD